MIMDYLAELRDFGCELDRELSGPPAGLRDQVLAGFTPHQDRVKLPGWPRRRPRSGWSRRRLAVTGAVAGGLAAVLLAIPVLGGRGTPGGASAQAAAVLHRAALAALRQRPLTAGPSQYLFVESVENAAVITGTKVSRAIDLRQVWLSASGTRDGLLREQPRSGTAPGRPTGRWQSTVLPGCHQGRSRAGVRKVTTGGRRVVEIGGPGSCTPDPAVLTGLPVTTSGMLAYLYQHRQGQNPPDEQAFITAGDLIRERYLTPRPLAALFRAVAQIPGVSVVHGAVTADGRHGIAVQRIFHGTSQQLIFNPATFAFIGEREVAISAASGLKPGTILDSTAVLRVAIVSHIGQQP
jgi:hypothetical protein